MASNEQGILGGFSGKVGTVVGGNWNGVDFMRGIASHIADPKTAAPHSRHREGGARRLQADALPAEERERVCPIRRSDFSGPVCNTWMSAS